MDEDQEFEMVIRGMAVLGAALHRFPGGTSIEENTDKFVHYIKTGNWSEPD